MRHSTRAWFTLAAACAAAAALGLQLSADARRDDPPTDQDVATRLLQAGLREQGAYATLEKLLSVGPRLTGSAQADAAVRLMAEHMTALGFEKVRTEPVTVSHWVRGAVEEGRILPTKSDAIPVKVRALGNSIATPPGGLTAGIVEVRSLAEAEQLGDRARGKIVFLQRRDGSHASRHVLGVRRRGAAAVDRGVRRGEGRGRRHRRPVHFVGDQR